MNLPRPDWLRSTTNGIKTLFFSDVHLLHPRVKTEDIASRLLRLIDMVLKENSLDYLVIAGDFFDEIRHFPDDDVVIAQAFMLSLLQICAQRNIKMRVLEGTPSHDRGQSRQFLTLNEARGMAKPADLKYIRTLDIVREEDGSTWLYVPDEWHHDPDVVWEQVKDRLYQEGLEKVDFAVTHGMYKHHLPPGVEIRAHDPDLYLGITNLYIDNGHIHSKSIYKGRFITNGSPDRLSHNEEERKGIFFLSVHPTDSSKDIIKFYENDEATYMVTIDVQNHTLDKAMDAVEEHCHPKEKRFLRLVLGESLHGEGILQHFAAKYPHIVWGKKIVREKAKKEDDLFATLTATSEAIQISNRNIADMLASKMRLTQVSETLIERAQSRLTLELECM